MAPGRSDAIIGVDAHKDQHVAGDMADLGTAMRHTLVTLTSKWLVLHTTSGSTTPTFKELTNTAVPRMLEQLIIGFGAAAEPLVAARDNGESPRSETAFTKMGLACPIPTGSGKTMGRHHLNRGGNQQADAPPKAPP